ncbi:hypothetical protein Dimus_008506 [Dionaea muscipula]
MARSKDRGVEIVFDHLQWHPFLVFQEIMEFVRTSRKFGKSRVDKKGEEPKRTDYFEETFLTMCKLIRENGVWWVGTGENRRRDDEIEAPAEEVHGEEEAQNTEFDWEVVIDEVAVQGESGSDDQFFDVQVDVEEPVTEAPAAPTFLASPGDSTNPRRKQDTGGVDPRVHPVTFRMRYEQVHGRV